MKHTAMRMMREMAALMKAPNPRFLMHAIPVELRAPQLKGPAPLPWPEPC